MSSKPILTFLLLTITTVITANAQWSTNGTNVYYTNGNVGIGITAPIGPFQVYGGNAYLWGLNLGYGTGLAVLTSDASNKAISFQMGGTEYVRVHSNGYFGIGTTGPNAKLTVLSPIVNNTIASIALFGYSNTPANRSVSIQQIGNASTANQYLFLNGGLGTSSTLAIPTLTSTYAPGFGFESNDNNLSVMTAPTGTNVTAIRAMSFLPGGNVLIGKTTQTNSGYILDVNGIARINKVVVNSTGADYVFDTVYKLPSLSTIERYIKDHHHLPDIAPARQMQEEGLDLGDHQTVLLAKIEELTLYLIRQNKEMEALKNEIELLKQRDGK